MNNKPTKRIVYEDMLGGHRNSEEDANRFK